MTNEHLVCNKPEVLRTDGLVVSGIEGPEGRTEGTLHLLVHRIILFISLQHRCVEGFSTLNMSVCLSVIKDTRAAQTHAELVPPYMMVALLLKTSLHWSRAGTVCRRWKVLRSH